MRLFTLATVFLTLSSLALAATIYVPDDFPTIQDAINSSNDYDTIIVRPGTYVENLDFCGMLITVMSEKGPEVTVIDGGKPLNPDRGSVVRFVCGENHNAVLDGFTLTNGKGTYSDPGYWGGGINIFSSSPSIRNNIITRNSVDMAGGGIHVYLSDPIIEDNVICDNTAGWSGGIQWVEGHVTFTGNVVTGNSGPNCCGGIRIYDCTGTVASNTITDNSGYSGGGLVIEENCSPVVEGNFIAHNRAFQFGGGICCYNAVSSLITNNVICSNTADSGGGIACDFSSSPVVVNNMIYANTADRGAGIDCNDHSSPIITNNTLYGNSASLKGGGIACRLNSDATVSNTIFWGNDAPEGSEIWLGTQANPSTVTIGYSDVKGGQSSVFVKTGSTLNWGAGMIDADPVLAGPAGGDFHLTYNSPCRDAGDGAAAGLPAEDFEGDPRVAQTLPDMGADEFHTHLYHLGDVVPGNPISVRIVGIPAAPVTLALGAGVYNPPLPTPYGDLYLEYPYRLFNMGKVPASGICVYNSKVPGNWSDGEERPFQALVGPLGNPNSVLTNLMVLEVE